MLEELDRIDWTRLEHAYGPATDVPELIRALRSDDLKQREQVMWELYGNIFHQGSVFEASAYAVPFLLELLATADTPDRPALAGLLASLAVGYDETWLPDNLPVEENREEAAGEEEMPEGGFDPCGARAVQATYDAVRAGVPLYRELLSDPDPALRCAVAYLLAWFPEEAAGSLPALAAAAAAGSDPTEPWLAVVTAAALVTIGLLDGDPPATALDDPDPVVRWAAAIALAKVRGAGAGPRVTAELLAWAGGERNDEREFPFLEGDYAGYASLALEQLGAERADAAFEALLARIPSVSGTAAMPVLAQALKLAFPTGPLPPGTPFSGLDDQQRRLLEVLADSPDTWRIDGMNFGNLSMLVGGFGLPDSNAGMRAYVTA